MGVDISNIELSKTYIEQWINSHKENAITYIEDVSLLSYELGKFYFIEQEYDNALSYFSLSLSKFNQLSNVTSKHL